jgi:hypothetical protein
MSATTPVDVTDPTLTAPAQSCTERLGSDSQCVWLRDAFTFFNTND